MGTVTSTQILKLDLSVNTPIGDRRHLIAQGPLFLQTGRQLVAVVGTHVPPPLCGIYGLGVGMVRVDDKRQTVLARELS